MLQTPKNNSKGKSLLIPLLLLMFSAFAIAQTEGEIFPVIDTFEFDSGNGENPTSVFINNSEFGFIYSVWYDGVQGDGFVKTYRILFNGSFNGTIDTFEWDGTSGSTPHAIKTNNETVYAVAYDGAGQDGFLKTLEILNNGTIVKELSEFEFDTSLGLTPTMLFLQNTIYPVVYRDSNADGIIKTFNITNNGTILLIDTFNFNDSIVENPDMIKLSDNIVIIAYNGDVGGDGNGGQIQTVSILNNGTINQTIDVEIIDAALSNELSIINIFGNLFTVSYQTVATNGRIEAYNISSDGNIEPSENQFFFDGSVSFIDSVKVGDNTLGIVFQDGGSMGIVETINVLNNGTVNNTIDELTYASTSIYQEILQVSGDLFLITYQGSGLDGFVTTLNISTQFVDELPIMTLDNPANATNTTATFINFNCTGTDDMGLQNITFYHNLTGTFEANETITASGLSQQANFNITIPVNITMLWNCEVFDDVNQNAFAPDNFTLSTFEIAPPVALPIVNLISPENASTITFFDTPFETKEVQHTFNTSINSSCELFVNETSIGTVIGNEELSITNTYLENQTVIWFVNCTAAETGMSEEFILNIIILPDPQVFQVGQCPETIAEMILLIFFIIVGFSLFALFMITRIGLFGFISGIILIVAGLFTFGCAIIMGFIFTLLGIYFSTLGLFSNPR